MTKKPVMAHKITPHLWFDKEAREAADFYTSVFPKSKIKSTTKLNNTPSGTVEIVTIDLMGQEFMLLSAGPLFKFNESISFIVRCKTQKEIDYYWERLSAVPEAEQCGWLKDKYGLSWQIVPAAMDKMMKDKNRERLARVTGAFLKMKKFDIKTLERAYKGRLGATKQLLLERRHTMKISVETIVKAPIEQVWRAYTTPEDITRWNAASADWHTTKAAVDLRVGGAFSSRMEAKDGSVGFDFAGTYTKIVKHELIEYSFGDRAARVEFADSPNGVRVRVTFDSEQTNPIEVQRGGWQAILDNFARHVEADRTTRTLGRGSATA